MAGEGPHLFEGSLEMRKEFLLFWSSWEILGLARCPVRFNWQGVQKLKRRILRLFLYWSRVRKSRGLG